MRYAHPLLWKLFAAVVFIFALNYGLRLFIEWDNKHATEKILLQAENQKLKEEIEQLKCNPFYKKGDKLLITPACDLPEKSQAYGVTEWKEAYGGMGLGGHPGVDWAMPEGTPIRATHAGIVFMTEDDQSNSRIGYGNNVKIRHRERLKGYETVYAHLRKIVVAQGDKIEEGQLIGYSGNTGFSSKPHLHFGIRFLWFCDETEDIGHPCEVLNGGNGLLGWVDPIPYLSPL